jgi:methylthioribose-1-phosphate isomerase
VTAARPPLRTIRPSADGNAVEVLDQTRLPDEVVWRRLETEQDAFEAIRGMVVRGAPLVGVTAAYGLWLAARKDPSDAALDAARARLLSARPTAVNLRWALDEVAAVFPGTPSPARAAAARAKADALAEADAATNRAIGQHGLALLREAWERKGRKGRVEVLTHCNAGALATVEGGTALAPVYRAAAEGIPVHVWTDETRPRGQGARLTAWELKEHGVPCTLLADVAAASLLRRGGVDLVIVGADRVAMSGDVANKVGTYAVALAAREARVPFAVACPSSTIDPRVEDGVAGIPIEERSPREVTHVEGTLADGTRAEVRVAPEGTAAWNPAFDVTPARLVTTLVTERGTCPATRAGILGLFPALGGKPVGARR